MKKDMLDKWMAALRSGKYPQAAEALRKKPSDEYPDGGYCCLGVLCDLMNPGGWQATVDAHYTHHFGDDWSVSTLTDALRDELQITRRQVDRLINLNDSEERSFLGIASWIEANVPIKEKIT